MAYDKIIYADLSKKDLLSPCPEFRRETSLKFPASGL